MQEDRYTDFDLQLRAMLEDAREEAPARVWDAVSGRLDRKRIIALRWRQVSAGIAAAAAIVAGVFIFTRHDQEPQIPQSIVADVPDITAQLAGSEILMADVLPAEKTEATAPARRKRSAAAVQDDQAIQPQETVSPAISDEETGNDDSRSTSRTDSRMNADRNDETDPFANLPEEKAGRRFDPSKLAYFVEGNVLTNDARAKTTNKRGTSSSFTPTSTCVVDKSSSTYGIPLTFGVGASYPIGGRWSVGTGLNYSLLTRTFTGTYYQVGDKGLEKTINSEIQHSIHYVGIPVNLYYDIITSPTIRFYAYGGGSVEKGIVNSYVIKGASETINFTQGVKGVQLSSALGLGLEFTLTDHLGLYLDPSARYYFDCNQPGSIRTHKRFMMDFEVGLRFDL